MTNEYTERFRRNLRRMRTDKGMSIKTLAAETGLTCQCIYRYESGDGGPNLTSVVLIAKALGCSIDELVGI